LLRRSGRQFPKGTSDQKIASANRVLSLRIDERIGSPDYQDAQDIKN
jgi:hypothetical protein